MAKKLVVSLKDFSIMTLPYAKGDKTQITHIPTNISIIADNELEAWPLLLAELSSHYGMKTTRRIN